MYILYVGRQSTLMNYFSFLFNGEKEEEDKFYHYFHVLCSYSTDNVYVYDFKLENLITVKHNK